jgi:hypothetical protein
MATSFAPARLRRIATAAPNVIALDAFSDTSFCEEETEVLELLGICTAKLVHPTPVLVEPTRIHMRAADPSLKKKFRTETMSRLDREYRW